MGKKNFKKGFFYLCKIKSNNAELENQVYSKYPEDKEHSRKQKVLAKNWNKTSDDFIFNLKEIRSKFEQTPMK